MARLIDADYLKEHIAGDGDPHLVQTIRDWIDGQPTIRLKTIREILLPKYRDINPDEYDRGYNNCLLECIETLENYLKEKLGDNQKDKETETTETIKLQKTIINKLEKLKSVDMPEADYLSGEWIGGYEEGILDAIDVIERLWTI